MELMASGSRTAASRSTLSGGEPSKDGNPAASEAGLVAGATPRLCQPALWGRGVVALALASVVGMPVAFGVEIVVSEAAEVNLAAEIVGIGEEDLTVIAISAAQAAPTASAPRQTHQTVQVVATAETSQALVVATAATVATAGLMMVAAAAVTTTGLAVVGTGTTATLDKAGATWSLSNQEETRATPVAENTTDPGTTTLASAATKAAATTTPGSCVVTERSVYVVGILSFSHFSLRVPFLVKGKASPVSWSHNTGTLLLGPSMSRKVTAMPAPSA